MSFKRISLIICLMFVCLITACSSRIDPVTGERADPLESFNRTMWDFNYHVVDPYLLKPIAKGWKNYVPTPMKSILTSMAYNLDEPASFVNRLLEGQFKKAMIHFNRFWINSIFGVFGLMDIASASEDLRIKANRTFGDTLGVWGVGSGSYIMLPFYGPTTPRQTLGRIVDFSYPMLSTLGPWALLKAGVEAVDSRSKLLGQESILTQSQDPYIALREVYFQNLEFKINDGNVYQQSEDQLSQDILDNIE